MNRHRVISFGALALLSLPGAARAQGRWKEIGRTASGNMVSVDARSVKRTGDHVAATVRVVFTAPVQTAEGAMTSTQTTAVVDCTAKRLAASENTNYGARGRVLKRTVNKIPGYSTTFEGSMGRVALNYLCASR